MKKFLITLFQLSVTVAVLYWVYHDPNRRAQMVDHDPDPRGNQAVRQDHTGRWLVRQLSGERPTPEGAEKLHMPHVATCPVPAPRPRPRLAIPRGRQGVRPAPWRPR